MVYLEYHVHSKQVTEIHSSVPIMEEGYDYTQSEDFSVGDEFTHTIWIQEVDENKNLLSFSAIKNNPQAKRLLEENQQLKNDLGNILFESAMDKAKISEVETTTGDLLMEIAMLKMGGSF